MKSEKDVKTQVKKLLDKHSWFWFMPPANAYGRSGISDFCAIRNGVFLAIETKFGKGKVSPLQRGFLGSVMSQHAFGFVVNENNLDWLDRWLTGFERSAQSIAENKTMKHEDGAELIDALSALTELLR